MKRMLLRALSAITGCSATLAMAVGVATPDAFKTFGGETVGQEPSAAVRIVPNPKIGQLRVKIRPDRARYHIGDSARFYFSANRDCRVYVFVTDSDGASRLVFPNFYDQDNAVRSGRHYYIPDRNYDLQVVGPVGPTELTIVAVEGEHPFLNEFRRFQRNDPFPAYRGGAAALTKRLEGTRRTPSVFEPSTVVPVPRPQIFATDTTSFYVMESSAEGLASSRYGTLDLYSQPDNARIFIDGTYYGRSPELVERLQVGYHTVRLEKEGFLPWERRVYIRATETRQLNVFLEPTPTDPGYSRSDKPENRGWGLFLPWAER